MKFKNLFIIVFFIINIFCYSIKDASALAPASDIQKKSEYIINEFGNVSDNVYNHRRFFAIANMLNLIYGHISRDALFQIFTHAYENIETHGFNDIYRIKIFIDKSRSNIIIQLENKFQGTLPPELKNKTIKPSSDYISVQKSHRERTKHVRSAGYGIPFIWGGLKKLIHPDAFVKKEPSIKWIESGSKTVKTIRLELTIPLPENFLLPNINKIQFTKICA